MTVQTGVVEQVSTKDVSTKYGVKPTFSVKLDTGWVKCGFKNPKVNVGDEVKFDGEPGPYGVEAKGMEVTKKGVGPLVTPVVPSSKPSYSGGGYKEKVFPIPPLHGDRSIVRQNALNRATDLYIGARGGKPFEVDSAATAVIIMLARHFEAYTAGDLDLAEAKAEVKSDSETERS
jgi:hypothetical protein